MVRFLVQILGSMVNLLYFRSQIMPKVSKEQNITFFNFECKKFKFQNFKILDIGFYFGLYLESE